MNVNHEIWHLRNNDPSSPAVPDDNSRTRIDIKFSFANYLEDGNEILSHANDNYTPESRFKRLSNLTDFLQSRLPAVAGLRHDEQQFLNLPNQTRNRVFGEFNAVQRITPDCGRGEEGNQWPFGWGTVHHACGTLRMPWKANRDVAFNEQSMVIWADPPGGGRVGDARR